MPCWILQQTGASVACFDFRSPLLAQPDPVHGPILQTESRVANMKLESPPFLLCIGTTPCDPKRFASRSNPPMVASSWVPHFILPISAPIELDNLHEPLTSAATINGFYSTAARTGAHFTSKNRFELSKLGFKPNAASLLVGSHAAELWTPHRALFVMHQT